jgi:hypothetical protein
MAGHVERGVTQSSHMVLQGSHDYVNVAHAWMLSIKLLQCSHYGLHDSIKFAQLCQNSESSLSINLLTSHACVRIGFLCVSDKVLMYIFHSTSKIVCFSASFTLRTLATMRKFVANHVAPGLSRLNP